MAQATSISLKKFTESVNAAVKAAVAKHPKFKLEPAHGVTVSYLIRGIPVPDAVLHNANLGELQSLATDVAQHVAGAHAGLFSAKPQGVVLSVGGRVIIGIPPFEHDVVVTE